MKSRSKRKAVRRAVLRVLLWVFWALLTLGIGVAYAVTFEPRWIEATHVSLAEEPAVRIIHFTDLHYRGDREYLERVVEILNGIPGRIVCFTGDLVESSDLLPETLEILARSEKPLYGVPSRGDREAALPFDEIDRCFRETGGAWLNETGLVAVADTVELVADPPGARFLPPRNQSNGVKRILLTHDPAVVDSLEDGRFDLILSGYTHGGQVRLPWLGRRLVPLEKRPYSRGLFRLPAGPLYVGRGVGTSYRNVRFRCRPEITLIEL